jgi:phage-related minor tail protein
VRCSAEIAGTALGTFIGDHIGEMFGKAKELMFGAQDASAKLTAQLGLSADEASGSASPPATCSPATSSTPSTSANDGIKSVVQNIGGMRTASTADLESVTGKVSELAQAMGVDLADVTKATGQMMKTGLAKNASEALDIITVGFQKGVDKSGDFLDTLNEYGVQFHKLGIDGKTATGLLQQGLQGAPATLISSRIP